ncbi:hypothetical protein DPMN_149616 [Dreissena polymorpha]|uniref:Uncharacterized protein n=1 Tax=Dreissena polymorpha TaxID=45954 RepID=A0A9D4FDV4_DREPO|nr:hypothetical protein DPMN_149616 [Dreissena polymorpha]
MKFFIIFSVIAKESLCQRGCYLSILDKSRLYTCVDERGGVRTDFSAWEVEHATVCTYTRCNTLQHIECADGSRVYVAQNDDGLDIEPLICDEASLLARKQKRVKKIWGWWRSPAPPPPQPPRK